MRIVLLRITRLPDGGVVARELPIDRRDRAAAVLAGLAAGLTPAQAIERFNACGPLVDAIDVEAVEVVPARESSE